MEQYIQGQSRDLVDQAYTKFVSAFLNVKKTFILMPQERLFEIAILFIMMQVSIMFVTLEKIAQTDPKYADVILLENYAAFQNRYVLDSCA